MRWREISSSTRQALVGALVRLPADVNVLPMPDLAWRMGVLISEEFRTVHSRRRSGRHRRGPRRSRPGAQPRRKPRYTPLLRASEDPLRHASALTALSARVIGGRPDRRALQVVAGVATGSSPQLAVEFTQLAHGR